MQTIEHNQGIEQAAILLLSMGEEAAANVLKQLDRDQVRELSLAMARIPAMKNEQVQTVYRRFFLDFKSESGISGASRATWSAPSTVRSASPCPGRLLIPSMATTSNRTCCACSGLNLPRLQN